MGYPRSRRGNMAETLQKELPSVSILIVNYNGADLLPGCLTSLASATYARREVVLVDNASTDNSQTILRDFPWVNVVQSSRNLGFAGGNNLGLLHCSGELVLLLNNDTIVQPGFLEPLCEYLASHPKVGVVQGKMILPRFNNTLDVCGSFLTAVGLPYHYGYFKPDAPKYQRPYAVFSGKGACLLFRREIISEIGGFLFDESFFCYYEESDFCHRAWLAGFEVAFVPGPPIQHLMGATGGRFITANNIQQYYVRNMLFSLCSNLSLPWAFRILPLLLVVLVVRIGALLVRLNFSGVAAHLGALGAQVLGWRRITKRRQLIRRIRKLSDKAIFEKCLRTPRPDYFMKTFRGDIGAYVDDDLPRVP
jgi:GT2 family glycosyltransferase